MHFSSAALVAAALSAGSASAHMIMKTPAPFGSPNSSPLLADGSDFPCKKITSPAPAGGATSMPIGAPQTLSFTGSAVHGGGSCQIALTTDKAPTPSSKWMVIHSIIGGCPSNSTDGNLAEDPSGSSANKYTYSIPSGISPGDYTLAWTWFNRVGNREMYMNCAPITVTGGSSGAKRGLASRKESLREALGWFNRRASFPDLFLANIGSVSKGCATVDSTDVVFPDPGDSVESDRGPSNPSAKPPTGCSASPSVPAAGGGGAAPTAAASGSAGTGAQPTAVTAGSGGAAPATTAAPSVAPVPTAPAAASQPAAASPTGASGSGSTGSSAGALSGACTSEGMWNCLGGTQFQRCASGAWSPAQPMPAGETCSGGQTQDLVMASG